jgi:hypothetical protein
MDAASRTKDDRMLHKRKNIADFTKGRKNRIWLRKAEYRYNPGNVVIFGFQYAKFPSLYMRAWGIWKSSSFAIETK